MERIIADAKKDAAMNKIRIDIELKKVSYYEFLREYDPASLTTEGPLPEHKAPELPEPANHGGAVDRQKEAQGMESEPGGEQVAALRQVIELKDEEMQQKDKVIEQKDEELTAHQKKIAALEARLQKLQQPKEGVPPV